MKKGWLLIIIGAAVLIASGVATTMQVLPESIVYIHSCYPYDGAIGTQEDFSELNAYVYAKDFKLQSIVYSDDFTQGVVTLERASDVTKNKMWIPDFNGDGEVGEYEWNVFEAAYLTGIGDLDYNPICDFDENGVINVWDLGILNNFYETAIYVGQHPNLPESGTVKFEFTARHRDGTEWKVEGSFKIVGEGEEWHEGDVLGQWYVDGETVFAGDLVTVEDSEVLFKFIKTAELADDDITVKANSDILPYKGSGMWSETLTVADMSNVVLAAETSNSTYRVSVIIDIANEETKEGDSFYGITMILGSSFVVLGVISLAYRRKKH